MANLGRSAPRDREVVSVIRTRNSSSVVPADAGTHNPGHLGPLAQCFNKSSHTTRNFDGTAYGSLRSQGRRAESASVTLPWPVITGIVPASLENTFRHTKKIG